MEISKSCNEIGSMTNALATLDKGVEALRRVDLDGVPDGELGDALVGIDRALARLEAQRVRFLGVFDQRRAFGDDAASAVAWLRNACHMTGAAAAARVAVARRLPQLEQAQHAFENGDITFQHAACITRVFDDVGPGTARQHEDVLVYSATTFDPSVVRSIGRRLLDEVDRHGAQAEANELHEERWLHVSPTLDGVVYIDGRLDPEGGAIVMSALDSLMAPQPGDARHVWQRRHDSFVELCRRHLDNGALPERGGLRPHVSLTDHVRCTGDDRRRRQERESAGLGAGGASGATQAAAGVGDPRRRMRRMRSAANLVRRSSHRAPCRWRQDHAIEPVPPLPVMPHRRARRRSHDSNRRGWAIPDRRRARTSAR